MESHMVYILYNKHCHCHLDLLIQQEDCTPFRNHMGVFIGTSATVYLCPAHRRDHLRNDGLSPKIR
jgi:hypothetical protein